MNRLTPRKIRAVLLIIVGIGLCTGARAVADSLANLGVSSDLLECIHLLAAGSIIPILAGIYLLATRDKPRIGP
jgi:hypothetical protein